MKKRLLPLLLALMLCVGVLTCAAGAAAPAGLNNFQLVNTYTPGQFADVPEGHWAAYNVQRAYEFGLVSGTGPDTFAPTDNITLGSVLALACRLNSIYYTGAASFTQGSPWYQVYVDYAEANGIVAPGQYSDYGAMATRRDMAGLLARSVPAEALAAKNTVEDGAIPDVAAGSPNYDAIYTLYRAGILTGSDQAGTFQPESYIDRASVAAMVTRVADPALRATIELRKGQVTGLALSQTSLQLDPGASAVLVPIFTPADAVDQTVTWSSSDNAVAVVNNGTVTGVAAGTCTVTAVSSNNIAAQCAVTVGTPAPAQPDPQPAAGEAPESVKVAIMEAALNGLTAFNDGLDSLSSAIDAASGGRTSSAATYANSAKTFFGNAQSYLNTAIDLCGNYSDTQVVKQNLTSFRDWFAPMVDYGTVTGSNVLSYVLTLDLDYDLEGTLTAIKNEFAKWSGSDTGSSGGSTSSGTTFYKEYPSVPDFGAYLGISTAMTTPLSDGGYSYAYTDRAVTNSGRDDWATGYGSLLESNGFYYVISFDNDDGIPVICYSNGRVDVMVTAMILSGSTYVVIICSPA